MNGQPNFNKYLNIRKYIKYIKHYWIRIVNTINRSKYLRRWLNKIAHIIHFKESSTQTHQDKNNNSIIIKIIRLRASKQESWVQRVSRGLTKRKGFYKIKGTRAKSSFIPSTLSPCSPLSLSFPLFLLPFFPFTLYLIPLHLPLFLPPVLFHLPFPFNIPLVLLSPSSSSFILSPSPPSSLPLPLPPSPPLNIASGVSSSVISLWRSVKAAFWIRFIQVCDPKIKWKKILLFDAVA